jgi:hypothetical protein
MKKPGYRIDQQTERWWLRFHPITSAIDKRIPVEWVLKRSTVSHKHHYAYFRIPKCANTTITNTLIEHDPDLKSSIDNSLRPKRASRGLFRAWAWSPESLAHRYFCFTFVRNPYTRLLSAYLQKISCAQPGQYSFVADTLGKKDITEVSFSDFIVFLEQGGLYTNAHWAPQTAMLPLPSELMSFIGHIETLNQDLPEVIRQIRGLRPFKEIHTHQLHRQNSASRITEFYDDALFSRVLKLYRQDFSRLGYPETPPS